MIPRSLVRRELDVIAARQKLRFFPITICGGAGSTVLDEAGREYIDLSANWGAQSVGYAHPRIVSAISEAAGRAASASILSAINPDVVELAEALVGCMPASTASPKRALFGHSGTDANTAAVEAIRAATGREVIVAFEGSYHGGFGAAKRISGVYTPTGSEVAVGTVLLPFPVCVEQHPDDEQLQIDSIMERLERVFSEHRVAAIFVEAQQSDGGVLVPPAGFMGRLAAAAKKHGALLVCDEVKIGLGRTGKFHGFNHDDVKPDLVTFGKALGGGLPISAVIGPAEILDTAPASALLTLAGGSIASASGLAALRVIDDEKLTEQAAQRGTLIRNLLADLRADPQMQGSIVEVRGRGLSLGIELGDPEYPDDAKRSAAFARRAVYRTWQLGAVCFLVRDNVIELTPPLVITQSEVEQAIEIIRRALSDVIRGAVTEEEIAPYQGW